MASQGFAKTSQTQLTLSIPKFKRSLNNVPTLSINMSMINQMKKVTASENNNLSQPFKVPADQRDPLNEEE